MTIMRIEELVYGVADLAAGTRYFDAWGLERLDSAGDGADFRLPSNQRVTLRPAGDAALPPCPDPAPSTLRETVWGVASQADLDAIGNELAGDREVAADADGTLHTSDPVGFAIGFRVSAPADTGTTAPIVNVDDDAPRLNDPVRRDPHARPIRIGHVVFGVPKALAGPSAEFYIDRLGFRLSEHADDAGDFMRCAGSRDHHNIFLSPRRDRARFDHAAFEVHDFDEIMMCGSHMLRCGWEAETQPGRHIMGSNLFWYFRNPCGGNTEYFADMDRMDDDWVAPRWTKSPGFAQWVVGAPETLPADPAAASIKN